MLLELPGRSKTARQLPSAAPKRRKTVARNSKTVHKRPKTAQESPSTAPRSTISKTGSGCHEQLAAATSSRKQQRQQATATTR